MTSSASAVSRPADALVVFGITGDLARRMTLPALYRLSEQGLLFLVVGWFPKVVITAIVFLVDPAWFHGPARVQWPEPTFRNFVAVALLALLASRPHAHAHQHGRRDKG
jgi:hypothetical protein